MSSIKYQFDHIIDPLHGINTNLSINFIVKLAGVPGIAHEVDR